MKQQHINKLYLEYHSVLTYYVKEKAQFFAHDKNNPSVIIEYFQKNPSHMRIMMTSLLNYIFGLQDTNKLQD